MGDTLRGIETEERAYQDTKDIIAALEGRPATPPDPPRRPRKTCDRCGRATSELMTSARGSVCPDCYDDDGGWE